MFDLSILIIFPYSSSYSFFFPFPPYFTSILNFYEIHLFQNKLTIFFSRALLVYQEEKK
jgi:hypothetical protein